VSAKVAAVAAIYPPVLFHLGGTRPSGGLAASSLPGADDSEEAAALASPIEHVSAALPPVMLLHGDADKVVPVSASRRYEERVRAMGGKVDLHIFAGLPHGFGNHEHFRPMMMTMIAGFFRRTVADPAVFNFGPAPTPVAAAPSAAVPAQ
jgi:dipeptidyl aminopeptidase/acylaminoacyl peptidase